MKERAGLVYAIESNRTIDVGLIIHHSILHGVTKDNAGLYQPSLITALYKVVGVVWSKSEEIQQPKYIIGDKLLRIMKNNNEEDPGAGSSFAAPTMPNQSLTMEDRMARLEAQMSYFGQYHQSFVQHQITQNTAIMDILTLCASKMGLEADHLPSVQPFVPPSPSEQPSSQTVVVEEEPTVENDEQGSEEDNTDNEEDFDE